MAEQWFEVWTACEDGWSDYHEENDETDNFDVAMAWLNRSDCQAGEIKLDGKIIVSKDRDGRMQFASGWCARGLKNLSGQ